MLLMSGLFGWFVNWFVCFLTGECCCFLFKVIMKSEFGDILEFAVDRWLSFAHRNDDIPSDIVFEAAAEWPGELPLQSKSSYLTTCVMTRFSFLCHSFFLFLCFIPFCFIFASHIWFYFYHDTATVQSEMSRREP